MIRDIAGRQNHTVKLARKLQKKKHRRERGLLVGEGMDLLRAAAEAGAEIRDVLVRRDLVEDLPANVRVQASTDVLAVGVCDAETLEYASSLGGAADVVFTCVEPAWSLADLDLSSGITFFLDEVGDPGNVGTIVRSALAFGLSGIMCAPGSADPYSPKAMRAGMGAQFSLPVITEVSAADLESRLTALRAKGVAAADIVVSDAHEGEDLRAVSFGGGTVIVLGAERAGAGRQWMEARRLRIAQSRFESLNVAMAATIFAYESSGFARSPESGK